MSVACFDEVNIEVAAYTRTTRRLGSTNRKKMPKGTIMTVCAYSNLCRGTLTPCAHTNRRTTGTASWMIACLFFPPSVLRLVFLFHLLQSDKKKEKPASLSLFSRQVLNHSFLRPHADSHADSHALSCRLSCGLSCRLCSFFQVISNPCPRRVAYLCK